MAKTKDITGKRFGKLATIGFKKDKKCLGMYSTLEEATKARKRAEEEYFEPTLNKYGKELKGDD